MESFFISLNALWHAYQVCFTKVKLTLVYPFNSSLLQNRHAHCFPCICIITKFFGILFTLRMKIQKPKLMVKTEVALCLEGKMSILSLTLN